MKKLIALFVVGSFIFSGISFAQENKSDSFEKKVTELKTEFETKSNEIKKEFETNSDTIKKSFEANKED